MRHARDALDVVAVGADEGAALGGEFASLRDVQMLFAILLSVRSFSASADEARFASLLHTSTILSFSPER